MKKIGATINFDNAKLVKVSGMWYFLFLCEKMCYEIVRYLKQETESSCYQSFKSFLTLNKQKIKTL